MNLPWQDIITWLIGLGALAYLTRRWWPGSRAKAACHDTDDPGPAAVKTTGCSGSCQGCGASASHVAKAAESPRA